jgi:PucR family transcriptional regulator, purine catabolism regulatory protein
MYDPLVRAAPAAARSGDPGWPDLHAAMLDVVLDGGDLGRAVAHASKHAGGTVAVAVPSAGLAVASPVRGDAFLAALRRYAGQRLSGEPAPVPDGLALELPVVSGGDELGLVALLDCPWSHRHEAAQTLHLTAAVTLVSLAMDGAAPDAGRLGGRLVADLLDRPGEHPAAEILVRARRAGSALAAGAVACCARPRTLPHRAETAIQSAFPAALVLHRHGAIHALLPAPGHDRDGARTTEAALRLARLHAGMPFALAPFERAPERLGAALGEAALAAAVMAAGAASAEDLHGGTYRLLVRLASQHPDEVRRFHARTVGPIAAYDGRKGTDILATLGAYLAHDGNMNATAAAIFAHRHTVAYRLERVRELTRLDPATQGGREQLGVGLKAHALLAAIESG